MAYTTIDDASAYFQTLIYTGAGGTADAVVNTGNSDLQPDLIWIKDRGATNGHGVQDTSRGIAKVLFTNGPDYEDQYSNTLVSSVQSDGFTMPNNANSNNNTNTYVAWQWKANGGTRTTNAESGNNPAGGYQVNTTAGFSIVDYVGTGAAGTMAHGLGVVPNVIIIKNRDVADAWAVYHGSNTAAPATDYLILNTNTDTADDAAWWNDTAPTSSVFTVNTDHAVNADAENYIAYCFTEIQGYSKIGGYVSNNNANGPFVYTGFKPAFVMTKLNTTDGSAWRIYDNKREGYNGANDFLGVESSGAENAAASQMDLVSNGFKLVTAEGDANYNDLPAIYMAFAETPFVTSSGVPATAR